MQFTSSFFFLVCFQSNIFISQEFVTSHKPLTSITIQNLGSRRSNMIAVTAWIGEPITKQLLLENENTLYVCMADYRIFFIYKNFIHKFVKRIGQQVKGLFKPSPNIQVVVIHTHTCINIENIYKEQERKILNCIHKS
jgi:hypothetical protein